MIDLHIKRIPKIHFGKVFKVSSEGEVGGSASGIEGEETLLSTYTSVCTVLFNGLLVQNMTFKLMSNIAKT